jgi:hypothetical protein
MFKKKNSSSTFPPSEMKSLNCLETLGYDYPLTQRHVQEERNSQLHCCENLKPAVEEGIDIIIIIIIIIIQIVCHTTGP